MVFTNLSLLSDLLGKTWELQDRPACNFMLRSFKTNEAAAVPERVNLGIREFVCMCENSFTVILFVCYLYNIKRNGKRLSTEKTNKPPSPLNVYSNPTSTCRAKASQWASAGSDYGYGGDYELPECHTPSTVLVCLSSACQTLKQWCPQHLPILSLPNGFTVVFGPEFCKLQICPSWPPAHHFSPPTDPSPWAAVLLPGFSLAQRSTARSYPPRRASPGSSQGLAPTLLLKSLWDLQKLWALVASCAKAHYSVGFFCIAALFLKLSWG